MTDDELFKLPTKDFNNQFDKFLKKWCGNNYAHLIDTDENDGQELRDFIEDNYLLKQRVKEAIENIYFCKNYYCCFDRHEKELFKMLGLEE